MLADLEILEKVQISLNKKTAQLDKSTKEKMTAVEEIIDLVKKSNKKEILQLSEDKKTLKEYNHMFETIHLCSKY